MLILSLAAVEPRVLYSPECEWGKDKSFEGAVVLSPFAFGSRDLALDVRGIRNAATWVVICD